ncbi:hypothetical protein MKS88_002071 [Plasmodium brasilianum]|uniref:Uncharacterized protein n=2 Tax=Plasmodium (Plasmodium) TaxID=418103 RepID=A0A1A8WKM4_PLAMA|nr:conserved Plasmodium protein, unknown function [Plasmodium malariae]KAI4839517.1 hypothetical protein MKS88_002071 [Plasmodium brasilianum]SBS93515.1 conserved Plasmodium protein, unknown function [Plasmodium malariae]SBT87939.1 conserved Plasmodium protein, unknown function [Plasmodium malariae]
MLVPPQFYNGEIVVDLDNTIFKLEAEKVIELYKKSIYNYLFNSGYSKNDEATVVSAINVDKRIRDLKKERLKNMGYNVQFISILLTFSIIYFACKGIIEHFKSRHKKTLPEVNKKLKK